MTDFTRHQITRVRRDMRRRTLTVTRVEPLSEQMLRVWLEGDDLADFESAGADDHVKLFVPDGAGQATRDYTPRLFDTAARTLAIDFALHGEGDDVGPATRWSMVARPGDALQVGGPRGSSIVPDDFEWYLLIGDETAIPAIARRIEELRDDAVVIALVAHADAGTPPPMPSKTGLSLKWVKGEGSSDNGLLVALSDIALPQGDGFVWIAAEADVARALRTHVVAGLGHPRQWVKASGYWLAGESGAHTKIGDD